MRVYSAAIAAVAALTVATAQTSTSTATSTVSTSSGSGNSITATAGSVSCVFRYSMPTATNLPSGVATTTTSSTTSSGSESVDETDGSSDMSGSVGDGSEDIPGTVGEDSDSASASVDTGSSSASKTDASEGSSSSASGSSTKTPATTTKTPTSTTKTPTSTTKTPSSTTKTPSSTTKTPSTSTSDSSTSLATTSPSTSATTTGSDDQATRRLMGEAGEAGAATTTVSATIGTTGVTAAVSSDSSGTTGSTATTAPSSTTATPSSTTKTPSSTTKTPASTTKSPSSTATTAPSSTTATPSSTSTTTTSSSSTSGSAGVVGTSSMSGSTTIEFSCDSTFYGAWTKMGLTCEGTELNVGSAAASTECLIYSGTSSGTEISDLSTCMSVCRFPGCNNGTWDYSAENGIDSEIYADLDFITLMGYAGTEAAEAVADAVEQPFSNLTFVSTNQCDYTSDSSFSSCQCAGVTTTASSSSTAGTATSSNSEYSVPSNKGLEDSNHWADGTTKSTVDKAGIASTTIGSSAATVSVVAGGVMSVASGVVGGTSAGVASGVSAAASVGITMAAVDICQFSIMLNQMNVDARPRFMENMGKKMAPAAFTFLPFGKTSSTSSDDSNSTSSSSDSTSSSGSTRRLTTGSSTSGSGSSGSGSSTTTTGVQGMEKYASLIGVDPDMLFYLAVAGIGCMVACLFGVYAIAMGICYFIVEDFPTFSRKWMDKAIGVLMMILILSEYVVGATAMYQICYCIDHDSVDVSFFLAIITLLGLALGTILYGVLVIKNNEDELRDLGTKDHFDKKFHARYGPLYDEHSFEGRFFFAPKLLLALLCGMTTGMVWIQGLWQIVVLIAFHIVFLLYLEIKQPYPTAFVQKTSSFVIIIKISALFLSFFLLSSATSFTESIPDDLREGVAFAIVGLQVLVLVCLMIRQVYIFYRTWKLKQDGASEEDKTVTVQTTNAREGSEAFFALGGEPQYYGNTTNQSRGNSLAVLGDDATPKMQDPRQYAQETPSNVNYNQGNRLRGLQPQASHGMTRTHTVVQHESHHRNNEVDL